MKTLALVGASGHGKVVADAALAAGWDAVLFFDDRWPETKMIGRHEVDGNTSNLLAEVCKFDGVVISIGDCAIRLALHRKMAAAGASLATIVHPSAWVSPSAHLGAGSVVMAGSVVQADASVGQSCIVNTCASVDHDCRLGDAVHVAPGARLSGNVVIGDRSWIGLGSCVRQGIQLGSDVTVGAGAVVVNDFGDALTLLGCPARPATRTED